jgi:hypothetical protein
VIEFQCRWKPEFRYKGGHQWVPVGSHRPPEYYCIDRRLLNVKQLSPVSSNFEFRMFCDDPLVVAVSQARQAIGSSDNPAASDKNMPVASNGNVSGSPDSTGGISPGGDQVD